MPRGRLHFAFLNVGHFLDHLFMLIFATVAALRLSEEWGMSYAALIPYATPGFVAFGICAIPAGWIADKWSRESMMVVFFVGIGASSIATALADSPLGIALGLFAIGVFAAIYHPVGLALVVEGREKTGIPLAINGVFGNLGVAAAALLTGVLIDTGGWRSAFVLPGAVSIALGAAYAAFLWTGLGGAAGNTHTPGAATGFGASSLGRQAFLRVLSIVVFTTAIGGLIFQSTTFALPKVFDERLAGIAGSATEIGGYAFLVFAVAALAQLVVGWLVDRHALRTVFAAVAVLQAVFFALMYQLTGIAALVVSIAFMLAVFGQIPINDVLIGRIAGSEWRSRLYAIRYIVTFTVMASTLPVIAGIHASWGFAALFVVMAVAAGAILARRPDAAARRRPRRPRLKRHREGLEHPVAVDQVDAFPGDLEPPIRLPPQQVTATPAIAGLLVEAVFQHRHGGMHQDFAVLDLLVDLDIRHGMDGAAGRLLRMDPGVIEARKAGLHHRAIVEEDRYAVIGVLQIGRGGDPVIAILGEQVHPFLEAAFVEQSRLEIEEVLDLLPHGGGRPQPAPHM